MALQIKNEDVENLFFQSFFENDGEDFGLWSPAREIDSDESDSDTSDDLPPKRVCTRINNYVTVIVPGYDDQEFREHFRLNRETSNFLIGQLRTVLPVHKFGREKVTPEKALLMTLWYVGNAESFRQIADRFDVSRGSAHHIIRKVVRFLVRESYKYIYWAKDEERREIITGFRNIKGINGVEGAIDGSHIKIPMPAKDQQAYCNRKGEHSILLQAVADHKKRFRDIFCGEAGSIHDCRMLKRSTIYNKACQGQIFNDSFLLGDSAYPNLHWLVPPFKDNGALTENQKIFNYKHSATRIVIENAFALLKGRFRRLKGFENTSIPFIVECVVASCVLHNICINFNESEVDVEYENNQCDTVDDNMTLDGFPVGIDKRMEVFQNMFPN